jgi:uncharacterized protein YycO
MKAQLNKPYNIPAYVVRGTNAITTESWYCSELVWASYNATGHDIQNYDWDDHSVPFQPGPTPTNLFHYKDAKVILGKL